MLKPNEVFFLYSFNLGRMDNNKKIYQTMRKQTCDTCEEFNVASGIKFCFTMWIKSSDFSFLFP